MQNTEYDKEFCFDIDAYLVEWYPTMNMTTRRSICALALEVLDIEDLTVIVDAVINDYAKRKQNIEKLEEDEEVDD